MTPLFSIITTIKNDAEGFRRTADSLAAQSYRGFQWIVCDGGSRTDTLAAIAAHADRIDWQDSRADGGPYHGMNRGLARARGRYLLFLNGGDWLVGPQVLADLARALADRGFPALAWGDALEDPGTGLPRRKPARAGFWIWYGMCAHHCAILYRNDIVSGLSYSEELRVAADHAFTIATLRRAGGVVRLPVLVAGFAPGGLSRRQPALGRWEQHRIRRTLLGMPRLPSLGIVSVQALTAFLRAQAPAVYARLRFRPLDESAGPGPGRR